jgi:hypothetical protein
MSSAAARTKLDSLVTLRGEIAHRVSTSRSIRWSLVDDRIRFLAHLAIASSNKMRAVIIDRTGSTPWDVSEFVNVDRRRLTDRRLSAAADE